MAIVTTLIIPTSVSQAATNLVARPAVDIPRYARAVAPGWPRPCSPRVSSLRGVEAGDDLKWWLDQGVRRFQSFAFAKPIDAHNALSKFIELATSIPLLELP